MKSIVEELRNALPTIGVWIHCEQIESGRQSILCTNIGKIVITNLSIEVRDAIFYLNTNVMEFSRLDSFGRRIYYRNNIESLVYLLSWYKKRIEG
jgi:hypothetical protein